MMCRRLLGTTYTILLDELDRVPRAVVDLCAHTQCDVTGAQVDHCARLAVLQEDGDLVGELGCGAEGSVVEQHSSLT